MKVKFIEESSEGVKWYCVNNQEVGLALDGTLIDGEGGNYDCIDTASIAKKESIISAIKEFEKSYS